MPRLLVRGHPRYRLGIKRSPETQRPCRAHPLPTLGPGRLARGHHAKGGFFVRRQSPRLAGGDGRSVLPALCLEPLGRRALLSRHFLADRGKPLLVLAVGGARRWDPYATENFDAHVHVSLSPGDHSSWRPRPRELLVEWEPVVAHGAYQTDAGYRALRWLTAVSGIARFGSGVREHNRE